MTEPATNFDPKKAPHVRIAGKDWPIPTLAVRQIREVRASLVEMQSRMDATAQAASGTDTTGAVQAPRKGGIDIIIELDRDDYDQLIVEVVYQALTRAHPALTRDEFLDMEVSDAEMTTAWLVARRQSNIFVFAESQVGANGQGEAVGAIQSPNQTGTE